MYPVHGLPTVAQTQTTFMAGPILFSLASIRPETIEAAQDLGGSKFQVFKEIIVPHSLRNCHWREFYPHPDHGRIHNRSGHQRRKISYNWNVDQQSPAVQPISPGSRQQSIFDRHYLLRHLSHE
jgi:hypothetical protein